MDARVVAERPLIGVRARRGDGASNRPVPGRETATRVARKCQGAVTDAATLPV